MKRALALFTAALQWAFDAALRRPKVTVIFAALFLLPFALALPQLKSELQVYNILDPSFPSARDLRAMKKAFGDGHGIFLIFHTSKAGSALSNRQACAVLDWAHREGLTNPELESVSSPFDFRRAFTQGNKLWYPLVLADPCEAVGDKAVDLRSLKESPWYLSATDRNLGDLSVEIVFKNAGDGVPFDAHQVGRVLASAEGLVQSQPGLALKVNGDASFSWHFLTMMRDDAFLNLLVLALFLLFFRIFYGTWRAGLLLAGTFVVTGTIVYGGMALSGTPVDLLTNNIFLITCIAGVEDFLFVAFLYRKDPNPSAESFRKILVPCFFTSFTTVLGFGSLLTSDLVAIQRFGLWSAVAALVEFGVTFYCLPAFCALLGTRWVSFGKARSPQFFTRASQMAPNRRFGWLSLVPFVAALIGIFHLTYDDSPSGNFMPHHPHSASFRYLRETRGWEGTIGVLFPDAEKEQEVRSTLANVAREKNVLRIENPLDVRDWISATPDPLLTQMVKRELKVSSFYRRSFSRDGQLRAVVYLKSLDLIPLGETLKAITAACASAQCIPVGESVVFHDYSNMVSRTLVESFSVSLGLIALTLWALTLALGKRGAWRLIYATAWSPIVILGAMALFHIPVNLVTCMFAAVIVGLTGDNPIQYLFASGDTDLEEGIGAVSGATVELVTLLSISSLVLLGLTLVPMKVLGGLFFAGFLTTLAGDLWLLRSLLPRSPLANH